MKSSSDSSDSSNDSSDSSSDSTESINDTSNYTIPLEETEINKKA